jgi:high affinity Mn2+ porin
MPNALRLTLLISFLLAANHTFADDGPSDHSAILPVQQDIDLRGQATYIFQEKPAFNAAYTLPGFNSLSTQRELSHSVTTTGYLGLRLPTGSEFYFNAEMVAGVPLSDLTGLASVPSAELQKASGPNPIFYMPRMFLRHTWGLGGGEDAVDSGINALAGIVDKNRIVLTAGKLSIVDIFDNNSLAHDGRKDFFNWVNVAYGAYDYAADVRGYTWGAAIEYYDGNWAYRAGRFAVPRQSNGLQLNYSIMNFYSDQVEVERDHEIGGQSGKIRVLLFRNRELMGRFDDALAYAAANGGGTPDVANVRRPDAKHGYGVGMEQKITDDLGIFARDSWNDGQTEMFSYTEVERSTQIGFSLSGNRWNRPADTIGVAFVRNGLSKAHQDYLAAGGTGFLIGDGKINYRPECATEAYYSIALAKTTWLTLDYQHFDNPAYNADRGPVNVYGLRMHTEF